MDHFADYGISTRGYTEAVHDVLNMNPRTLVNFLADMVGPSNVPTTPAQIRLTAAYLIQEEMKHRRLNPEGTLMPFPKELVEAVRKRAAENESMHVNVYVNDMAAYTPSAPVAPLTAETVEAMGTPAPAPVTAPTAPVVAPTVAAAPPAVKGKRGRKDTGAMDTVRAFFNANREAIMNKDIRPKSAATMIAAQSNVAENTAMVYLYKCIKEAKGS